MVIEKRRKVVSVSEIQWHVPDRINSYSNVLLSSCDIA